MSTTAISIPFWDFFILMKKNLLIGMFACFFVIGCAISFGGPKKDDARIAHPSVIDPLNASYPYNAT